MADSRQVIAQGEGSIALGGNADHSVLITGNGARVFVGEYVDLTQPGIDPALVFKRVQLERFTLRGALEAEVDRFLCGERGYLILEGGAGLGKTTFAAYLATSRGYVHHFAELCPGDDKEKAGIRNLAAQLARAWKLMEDDSRYLAWAAIGPELLQETIRRAAASRDARAPGEKIVIVIDALDEAGANGGQNVLGLPASLPAGVYVICTKRPVEVSLRINAPHRVVRMTATSHGNEADLCAYLTARAHDEPLRARLAPSCPPAQFVRLVLEKSQGSWIYVQYLVAELEAGLRQPADLASLPIGLWHYYADFFMRWARLHGAEWKDRGARLLAALAAIQEDLPLEDLCTLAGIADVERSRDILALDWSPFTTRTADVFRFSHATLRDFVHGRAIGGETLQNNQQYFIDRLQDLVRVVNGDFSRYYLERWFGSRQGQEDIVLGANRLAHYGANHLPHHLIGSGDIDGLHDLLSRSKANANAWYELKMAQGDLAGYRRQLEAARACVVAALADGSAAQPAGLGLLARYGFMLASLTSMASNVPQAFVGFAVDTGIWTLARAIGHAELCEPGEPRAEAFSQLLSRTEGKQRRYCLAQLIDSIDQQAGFPLSHFQADMWEQVLSRSGGKLAHEDYAACFDAICRIDHKEDRLRALHRLAQMPVGPVVAGKLFGAASFHTVPRADGTSLDDAFRATRCIGRQLEIMFLALAQATGDGFDGRPAGALYAQLIGALDSPGSNPRHKAACLRILATSGNYREAAAQWHLPPLQELVDACMDECARSELYGAFGALALLPLVDEDRKTDFYLRLVEPAIGEAGYEGWESQIAKENPSLRARLCAVLAERALGTFSLAKSLGSFVEHSEEAFHQLRQMPLTGDFVRGLIRSRGLTAYAARLPEAAARALACAVDALDDPAVRAEGLAWLACAQGPDWQALAANGIDIALTLPEQRLAKVLAVFASSGIDHLGRVAYRASGRLHDADALAGFLCALAPGAGEPARTALVRFLISLLPEVAGEWNRFELIRHLVSHLGARASDEQLQALEQAYGDLCDRSPERDALWFRHLVRHAPPAQRARHLRRLEDVLAGAAPRLVTESLAEVWSDAPPEARRDFTARIIVLLGSMDEADRRYVLPGCAPALPPDVLRDFCSQVVDETGGSKLYKLEELCKVIAGPALAKLARRAESNEEVQLLPALAGALAREGLVLQALSVAEQVSPHRIPDAYDAMLPWLGRPYLEALCTSLGGHGLEGAYVTRRIDQLIAKAALRLAAIGEPDLSFALMERIGDPGLRLAARMRHDRFWAVPPTAGDIAAHVATFVADTGYHDREPIRQAVMDRACKDAPRALVLAILVADLELAAQSGRSEVAYVLQDFMPVFERLLGLSLATTMLDEVRAVRTWWA